MDEIDDDGDAHRPGPRLGVDAVDLVVVAVYEGNQSALVVRVAPVCLVEDLAEYLGCVFDHAGCDPLRVGFGRWRRVGAVGAGEHVGGAAGYGRYVVDGAHLGEALAVTLLPFG